MMGFMAIDPDPPSFEDAIARALLALGEADLLRLEALARLRSHGLPGIDWRDLLHEAVLRALDGRRRWPPGITLVVFLAGIMRSLADRHRVEARRVVPLSFASGISSPAPEIDAWDLHAWIDRLFAHDSVGLTVLSALAEGHGAAAIRRMHGLSETEYATVRKRIRRRVLRAGLGKEP